MITWGRRDGPALKWSCIQTQLPILTRTLTIIHYFNFVGSKASSDHYVEQAHLWYIPMHIEKNSYSINRIKKTGRQNVTHFQSNDSEDTSINVMDTATLHHTSHLTCSEVQHSSKCLECTKIYIPHISVNKKYIMTNMLAHHVQMASVQKPESFISLN